MKLFFSLKKRKNLKNFLFLFLFVIFKHEEDEREEKTEPKT